METIIGLLFILLPVIFKLIGKKLEQSGKTGQAETLRKITEALGEEVRAEEEYDDEGHIIHFPEQPAVVPAASAEPVAPVRIVQEEGRLSIARKSLLAEEEENRKKDKIDPKKLVIYSEIMKPKY